MTKRVGNFSDTKCKKSKTENHVEDLWDDDLDECLVLATQVCEQNGCTNLQNNNVSILQNYSIFEHCNKNGNTSTQKDALNSIMSSTFMQPSKSYGVDKKLHQNSDSSKIIELKEEIRIWKERCESKDGEVTILRTQLKEIKHNLELDYQKKEKELLEKMNICNKEVTGIKSQLGFKNLEVMNLKNKLSEVSKAYTADSLLEAEYSRSHTSKRYRLKAVIHERYPFTNMQVSLLFAPEQPENFSINFKSNIDYDLLTKQDDQEVLAKYRNITESKCFKLGCMFSSVMTIMRSRFGNTANSSHHIDQILTVAKDALTFLYDYLSIQERFLQNTDDQDDVDFENGQRALSSNLSIFDPLPWYNKEIGIKARQTVGVIAEILPHNHYLQKELLDASQQGRKVHNYLDCIKVTVALINETASMEITQGFLCAVAAFLHRTSQTNALNQKYLWALDVFREVISAKASHLVLKHLLLFLRQASICSYFVQELCKKSPQKSHCYIDLFLTVYTSKIINTNNIDIAIGLNALQLIINLLNCNPMWFHYEEKCSCDCICKINTFGIGVIHELVKSYKKAKLLQPEDFKQYATVFKNCVKLLHIINFKYFDTINKYFVDSQYKFIINYLSSLGDTFSGKEFECEALREINMQDDIYKISNNDFDKIPIWS